MLPGVASQPHQLLGRAAYLNPGRKALTVTRLPQVKTARSESQDTELLNLTCLPHPILGACPGAAVLRGAHERCSHLWF